MRTKSTSFVVFLLAMAAVAGLLAAIDRATPGGPLPTPTSPPTPMLRAPSPVVVEPNRRPSVVLVSLGGASAEALYDWMANGDMPTLSRLADRGWIAPLRSVSPPLPDLALAALATGSTSPEAEPIWQTAARHHRTTALLFWPGAEPGSPDRRADLTISCAPPLTAAGQQTTTLVPADPWTGTPASFGPSYEGVLTFPSPAGAVSWRALAVDTIDDHQAVYDTFFLAPDSDDEPAVGRNTKQLALGEWATLPVPGPGMMLAITGQRPLTSTATLSATTGMTPTETVTPTATITPTAISEPRLELSFYRIAVRQVLAHPTALGQEVIERLGFCPPLADPAAVTQGELPAMAFRELAERRARWTTRAAAYVHEAYRPHLLLVRQDALSASEQALLLVDPRQSGYSRTRVAEFANHRRAVAAAADDGLADLLAAVDLNYASVLVVSEYGTEPVHTEVDVAAALQPVWEQLRQPGGSLLQGDPSPRIFVEGAFLSVEIGSDWDEGYDIAADTVHRELTVLTNSRTGNPVFAQVVRRSDAGAWAATWPYPGDILAQAAPGYVPSATLGADGVFSEAQVYGQTGYAAHLPAMQGLLIVAGRGVSAADRGSIARLDDVAPWAATLWGVPPPTDVH